MAIIRYQIIVLVMTLHFYLPDPLLPLQIVLPYALALACPSAHSFPMQGYGRHQRHSTARVQGRGGCRDQSINVAEPAEDQVSKPAVPGPLDVASLLGRTFTFPCSTFTYNKICLNWMHSAINNVLAFDTPCKFQMWYIQNYL